MAEQKCPMCGKINPSELDICQFCQARLKPLIVNQPDQSQDLGKKLPSDSPSKVEAAPDWLRSLRDHQEGSENEPVDEILPSWPKHEEDERPGLPTGEESIAPNWLDSLRSPTDMDEGSFNEEPQGDEAVRREEETWPPLSPASEEEAPDWLSGIRADPELADQDIGAPLQGEDSESPDWLERIRSRQQAESAGEEAEPESELKQEQDLPDWLRSEDVSHAEAISDWPSSIRDRDEDAEGELPGWLSESKDEGDEDAPSGDEKLTGHQQDDSQTAWAADGIPDWMEGEDSGTPAADEFPDWLETGESLDDEQNAEPDALGWMKGFSQDQEPEIGDDIDWLQASGDTGNAEEEHSPDADSSAESEAETVGGLTDWLKKADQEPIDSRDEENPDWLSKSKEEPAVAEDIPEWLQPKEVVRAGPEDEIPDWLSDTSADEGYPEETLPASPAEDLPEWLADLDHDIEADVAEAAREEEAAFAEPAEEIPEWLAGAGPMLAETPQETPEEIQAQVDSFEEEEFAPQLDAEAYDEEVPEWLMDVKAGEEGHIPSVDQPAGSKDAGLAPAELPSWLEAMRPVETEVTPEILDERDRQVVSAGPLAGLRGVLPAEPEIAKVQKPPAYSVKLQVSDMQRERASMLEELIKAEGEARPIPGRPLVSSQHLLRMAFAIILFLAVLWPLVAAGPVAPIPVFSPETGAANQLIGQLNSQGPVLVAVDYQPGLSGEMDAIASTLFDHLMLRGVYLTLVSTTASGPIQAEHVVALTDQQFGHSYAGADEYTNLGYIPGGPTGLISFAANPRAMMAYALDDGRPAWENSPLQQVQNLSDFALVTVITDNPETARAWIEQVQPVLGDRPLIMAISAQAEPMVRPYYEAFPKQVQGMVVGLAGSAEYESLMGHPGLAHSYWNSFGIGLLAAIILIFVGGLFNMVPLIRQGGREKPAEREEPR